MPANNSTEFDVMGLVIFDRADLPEVTTSETTLSAGETIIQRSQMPSLSYEVLKARAMEAYALALTVRDLQSSPELERVMALLRENSAHTNEEARQIALKMVQSGVSFEF